MACYSLKRCCLGHRSYLFAGCKSLADFLTVNKALRYPLIFPWSAAMPSWAANLIRPALWGRVRLVRHLWMENGDTGRNAREDLVRSIFFPSESERIQCSFLVSESMVSGSTSFHIRCKAKVQFMTLLAKARGDNPTKPQVSVTFCLSQFSLEI